MIPSTTIIPFISLESLDHWELQNVLQWWSCQRDARAYVNPTRPRHSHSMTRAGPQHIYQLLKTPQLYISHSSCTLCYCLPSAWLIHTFSALRYFGIYAAPNITPTHTHTHTCRGTQTHTHTHTHLPPPTIFISQRVTRFCSPRWGNRWVMRTDLLINKQLFGYAWLAAHDLRVDTSLFFFFLFFFFSQPHKCLQSLTAQNR